MGASAIQAAHLEQALNVLQATAGLTDEQLAQAGQKAQELGADLELPGVSATDAAEALLELSKAGLDFQQAMAGTKGVLQLAAASGLSFADSAQTVGNALNTFGLPGSAAVAVVDALANASKLAQGEMGDFGLALKQAGAVANLAGLNLDETTAALTILAKAGISGSDAGTSVRTMLLRLIPTSKEAKDTVAALGISVSDSEGNIRPFSNILEQYRQALEGLTPATKQAALATIFGTDAIRAAAILTEGGSAAFEKMTDAIGEQGTAADIAAAKNKGMLGAFRNLSSQVQTVATNIGSLFTPAITNMVNTVAGAVGEINDLVTSLKNLSIQLSDLPGGGTVKKIGDELTGAGEDANWFQRQFNSSMDGVKKSASVAGEVVKDKIVGAIPGVGPLKTAFDGIVAINDLLAKPPEDKGPRQAFGLELFLQGTTQAKSVVKKSTQELAAIARLEGQKLAQEAAISGSKLAVANAQAAVAGAKVALAETIKAGQQAVAAAIQGAKSNLISIGQDLSQRAAEIIDNGPLGKKIKQLQDQLAAGQRGTQRRDLRANLRDAEKALADAQEGVATAGTPTAAQAEAMEEFLAPFEKGVADAQDALKNFSTEGVIDNLQKAQAKMKEAVTRGIADTIAAFNTGRISADEANRRIAAVLGKAKVDYKTAGTNLGLAFNEGFTATLKGLQDQIAEIVAGPQSGATGFEPTKVSPGEEAARAAGATAAARVSLAQAQQNLAQTSKESLAENKAAVSLLGDIKNELREFNKKKPVAKPKGIDFLASQPSVIHDRPGPTP